MTPWLTALAAELHLHGRVAALAARDRWLRFRRLDRWTRTAGTVAPALVLVAGLWSTSAPASRNDMPVGWPSSTPPRVVDLTSPVRREPTRFLARSHLPPRREEDVAGALRPRTFFPQYDLLRVEDARVWWESDNDRADTEDDHLIHRAMEEPLRRLIELVSRAGGTLEVHDAYRPRGVHAEESLHREGRAVDITCDQLGLEKLAKLAWASGFDWVYYEVPRRGGAHVHASVREDHLRLAQVDPAS